MFDVRDLTAPIVIAPMAGGPSTPELAAAGSNAGALGFIAAGYLSADVFAERLRAAAELTSGPLGANLFVPHPSAATPESIDRYAAALSPDAQPTTDLPRLPWRIHRSRIPKQPSHAAERVSTCRWG